MISVVLRFLADALELLFEFFQVLVRKLFKIDKFICLKNETWVRSRIRSTMRASLPSGKPTLISPPV